MGARYVPIIFSADTDTALKAVRQMTHAFEDLDESAERTSGGGLQNAFLQADLMGRAVSFVSREVIEAAKSLVSVGIGYEQAMNLFQASTHATEQEMVRAAQAAQDLGADVTLPATSAADAALAMNELGKANFTASQAIDAARGTLQLAAAANVSEAEAATMAANALNSFHLQASESTRVADLLAAAANSSSAEITDIAQSMTQASAVFASAKVPIEDLTTMIGLMANAGIKGSDAGTSLKTMLQSLQAPTKGAAVEMEQLQLKVFDAQGTLKPFRTIVQEFSDKLSTMTDEQKAHTLQTIFGTDAMRAAIVVFGQGGQAYDQMRDAVTRQGAAAELAAARTKGLGGAWDALTSQLESGGLAVFDKVSPLLTGILGAVNRYPAVFLAAVVAVTGLAAAHMLWNTQLLISAGTYIPQLIANLRNLISVMFAFNQVTSLSATGMLAFAAGWLGAAAAAGLLIYQLVQSSKATQTATDISQQHIDTLVKQRAIYSEQQLGLSNLGQETTNVSERQQTLDSIYKSLNTESQVRIDTMRGETDQAVKLQIELDRLAKLRTEELELIGRTTTALFVGKLQEIDQNEKRITSLITLTRELRELQTQVEGGRGLTEQQGAQFNLPNNTELANQLSVIQQRSSAAQAEASRLRGETVNLQKEADTLGVKQAALAQRLGQTTTGLVDQTFKFNLLSGNLDYAKNLVSDFGNKQNSAADSTSKNTGKIKEQADEVFNLRQQLNELTKTSQSAIDNAVYNLVKDAVQNGKTVAQVRQAAREKLNDPSFKGDVDKVRLAKEAQQAAESVLSPSLKSGGGSRANRAVDQAARADIRLAELDLKAAERLYKEATEAAQREYDLRNLSLSKFTQQQIASEETLKAAKLAALGNERDAASKITNNNQRNVALREVSEKEKDIVSETAIKIQQLRDSASKKELDSFREFGKVLLDLTDGVDKRRMASMEAIAETGLVSFERVEHERLAIQTASFQRHREVLSAELAERMNNLQDTRGIVGQLMKLAGDEATAKEESARRISAARLKDIENARRHAQQLRDLSIGNQQLQAELDNARLDRLEKLGANQNFIKAARADQDVRAEIARYAQAKLDIISARSTFDTAKPEVRAAAEEAFRNRQLIEETRHQENLREIRERPLIEYMARIKSYADGIGDMFARALTTWDKGFKGFFSSMYEGFKSLFQNIVSEFIKSRVSSYIQSLFNPQSSNSPQLLAHSNSGGGFNLSSLLNMFGGGNGTGSSSSSGGIMGTIRNLIGFGGRGAAPAAATSSASGGGLRSLLGSINLRSLIGGGASAATAGGGSAVSALASINARSLMSGGLPAAGGTAAGGSSMFGSLGALFTNPWTAVVAGAAIGGFFLYKHFQNGTEKKLREAIQGTYGIGVKDMQVLKQVKEMGEQAFGKGQVSKHIAETIKLEQVKELLATYAESTGQKSSLVTQKQLTDPANPLNNFTHREFGGPVERGTPYIVGEKRPELFVPDEAGYILPFVPEPPRVPAPRVPSVSASASSSGNSQSSSSQSGGGMPAVLAAAHIAALQSNTESNQMLMRKISSMPYGALVAAGIEENPNSVADGLSRSLDGSHRSDELKRKLGGGGTL